MIRILVVLVGLLMPVAAGAQTPDPEFDGIWAQGGCESPTETLYQFSRLRIRPQRRTIEILRARRSMPKGDMRLRLWRTGNAASGGRNRAITFEWVHSGRLHVSGMEMAVNDYETLRNATNGFASFESPPEIWTTTVFDRCSDLPPEHRLIHGSAVRLFERFRALLPNCPADTQACAEKIVLLFDITGDGMLSKAEIARAIRSFSYIAVILNVMRGSEQPHKIPLDDFVTATGISTIGGPVVADALLGSADYNGDGKLDPKEIFQDMRFESVSDFDRFGSGLDRVLRQMLNIPAFFGFSLGPPR